MIKRPLVATMISTIWTTPSPSQSPRKPPTVAKNSVLSNLGKYEPAQETFKTDNQIMIETCSGIQIPIIESFWLYLLRGSL